MLRAIVLEPARNRIPMTPRNEHYSSPGPASIDIMDVMRGVGRRKLLILSLGLLAFGGAVGIVKMMKPVYSTEAQVLIQNQETPFDRVQPLENQRGEAIDDRIVASQISVIKSEDLGRRVVAALGLETVAEFNPMLSGVGQVGKIKIALGFGSDPRLKTPEQRALDHYADKLSVYQLPDSNVVGIKYSSSSPEMAAKVANTLTETYVMWTREAQSQPTERARDWLSSQIDALRSKLATSEMAVEKFRTEAGLFQGASTTLGTQEISELNSQITIAKSASLEARAKADAIRDLLASRGSVDAATDVLASAAVQRLKEQRTEAVRRRAELSVTYLSNHPKLIAVQNEISNIDKQIRSEALKVVSSLDEQARIAESREKSLIASLEGLKSLESSANLDDVKLKALEREAAADRILLEALLSRYAEASARQDLSAQPGLGVVIQTAGVPSSPTFPKSGPMVMLISIAGLSFGLGLAFLMELMSAASRLATGRDAEMVRAEPSFAPAAAEMPDVHPQVQAQPDPEPIAVSEPLPQWMPPPMAAGVTIAQHLTVWPRVLPGGELSGVTENPEVLSAARSMAAWAQDVRNSHDVRRIGITSLGGGAADAPIAALVLARILSLTGKRIVVVDLARLGSFLGGLCGVPHGPGLSDLISGAANFTKVIGRDTKSTVHVLRFGLDHSPRTAGQIVERIDGILDALAQTYDTIVVNLGEAAEETPIFLHKCQGALLLATEARADEAKSAVQTLLETGVAAAQHVLIGQSIDAPAISAETGREAIRA
jgi:polysaccharide biosynthesis transport protein